MSIKVIIAGFKGRMGSTALDMVKGDSDLEVAALLDPFGTENDACLQSKRRFGWL